MIGLFVFGVVFYVGKFGDFSLISLNFYIILFIVINIIVRYVL